MDKEKFEKWTMEYLSEALHWRGEAEFEKFLVNHPEYREEFEGLNQTWNQINNLEIPQPSPDMDSRFFEMLQNEIEKEQKAQENPESRFLKIIAFLWKPQLAYGILLLVVGLSIGYFLKPSGLESDEVKTTVVDSQETEEVREKLVLTLLQQPSATKRLQGIGEVSKISKLDEKVIDALLQTLNNDANVNVRLAAIESLTNYLDNPKVREGLVQSIVKQDSPIVQVTLANLMVALQEKKSIESFKVLMQTKELDKSVKQKLETSINSII